MGSKPFLTTPRSTRLVLGATAILAFLLFLAIGWYVMHFGEPAPLVAFERATVDHATLLALTFTKACYPYVLGPLGIVLLILAWRFPTWRARILFSLVMLLLCWRVAALFQHLFARPRRLDWVLIHEKSFSFPSSHASIALGFYALWAVLIWQGAAGRLRWAAFVPAALVVGIYWSRLALGAHFATDLAGGALLAVALVLAGAAVSPIKVLGVARPEP